MDARVLIQLIRLERISGTSAEHNNLADAAHFRRAFEPCRLRGCIHWTAEVSKECLLLNLHHASAIHGSFLRTCLRIFSAHDCATRRRWILRDLHSQLKPLLPQDPRPSWHCSRIRSGPTSRDHGLSSLHPSPTPRPTLETQGARRDGQRRQRQQFRPHDPRPHDRPGLLCHAADFPQRDWRSAQPGNRASLDYLADHDFQVLPGHHLESLDRRLYHYVYDGAVLGGSDGWKLLQLP